jgi:hypothetical protein
METSERNRCSICGSPISDNNTSGIGFGCMANVVKPAINDCFKELHYLDYWSKMTSIVQQDFINAFESTKFRNEFKKSFFTSISTATHISKKQLGIMQNMLLMAFKPTTDISTLYRDMKASFNPHIECPELYKEKIELYYNLYIKKKKPTTNDD